MIHIVAESYVPNTANTNRLLAFVRGFDDLEEIVTLTFIVPDNRYNRMSIEFKNIDIRYLWNNNSSRNKYIRKFSLFKKCKQLIESLCDTDVVILFGCIPLVPIFVRNFKGKLFHERTEHPDVVRRHGVLFNFLHKIYLSACRKLDGLFVISNPLKEYFVSVGVDSERIHIINMIVDSYRFDKLSKSECSNTISYCGTISIEKDGVDTLIKAFALISNKYPNHKLIIYGKCPKIHDLKLIRNLIIQHNLEKRVVLPGIVTYEEMPKCLKNSDVLVLARPNNLQARCGFPTKLGEYLLTENPVVVTAVGDIPRFLSNRFSALLAQPSNVVEISNQIAWAIDNPQQALKIGRNGAKVALRSFNYLVETHKILSIIYESKN